MKKLGLEKLHGMPMFISSGRARIQGQVDINIKTFFFFLTSLQWLSVDAENSMWMK